MELEQYLQEDHLEFLDYLRETGITNMYGAAPYLQDEFPELSKTEARKILTYWMQTFSERHSGDE